MNSVRIARAAIPCAIAVAVLGCHWVPLTEGGARVRLLRSEQAAECEEIGTVNAKTSDRVIIFARTERKVREELESLARNEAAEMGGDAVVPIGRIETGRQSFAVHRCPGS